MIFKRFGVMDFIPLALNTAPKGPFDVQANSDFLFCIMCLEFTGDIPPPIDRFLSTKIFINIYVINQQNYVL